jgi:hypothetical protein
MCYPTLKLARHVGLFELFGVHLSVRPRVSINETRVVMKECSENEESGLEANADSDEGLGRDAEEEGADSSDGGLGYAVDEGGDFEGRDLPLSETPEDLSCCLKPYQQQGLTWMLRRETPDGPAEGCLPGPLHPLWYEFVLPSGVRAYLKGSDGTLSLLRPEAGSRARGGILADGMGLGKTIQVLALLASDPPWAAGALDAGFAGVKTMESVAESQVQGNVSGGASAELGSTPLEMSARPDPALGASGPANEAAANEAAANEAAANEAAANEAAANEAARFVEDRAVAAGADDVATAQLVPPGISGTKLGVGVAGSVQRVGGTLVVCPLSVLGQWRSEAERHLRAGRRRVLVHYDRRMQSQDLARAELVLSTYGVVVAEHAAHRLGAQVGLRRLLLQLRAHSPRLPRRV